MAYWLILAGRVEDGQTYIDAARRVHPRSDKDLGYVTAAAEFSRGRYVEAAAAAEKDQVNYPNDPSMRLLLAAIYGHLGRLADASSNMLRRRNFTARMRTKTYAGAGQGGVAFQGTRPCLPLRVFRCRGRAADHTDGPRS